MVTLATLPNEVQWGISSRVIVLSRQDAKVHLQLSTTDLMDLNSK